jgi:hypothetical protein
MKALQYFNEAERLKALARSKILDIGPQRHFDDINLPKRFMALLSARTQF